jgi:hypothetical protein
VRLEKIAAALPLGRLAVKEKQDALAALHKTSAAKAYNSGVRYGTSFYFFYFCPINI